MANVIVRFDSVWLYLMREVLLCYRCMRTIAILKANINHTIGQTQLELWKIGHLGYIIVRYSP